MYSTTISWGKNRETVFEPITDNTIWNLISRLQTLWDANVTTENFSAKIMNDEKLMYDGPINQLVIDGLRYNVMKEMMENG